MNQTMECVYLVGLELGREDSIAAARLIEEYDVLASRDLSHRNVPVSC
jgi:hypothetical protein